MNNNYFNFPNLSCFALLACFCSLTINTAVAETLYVTDVLQLELYETMQMTGSPLKRLRSGDSMEVLQKEGRYTRVRLEDGETGWLKSLYLVDKEPARARLNKLDDEFSAAQKKVASLEKRLADRDNQLGSLKASNEGSAGEEEARLAELDMLRIQNSDLQSRVNAYSGSVPVSWLLICLVATLITGFIAGWYTIDRRSRARHGGYRVY
jgi:SH3 domain protein